MRFDIRLLPEFSLFRLSLFKTTKPDFLFFFKILVEVYNFSENIHGDLYLSLYDLTVI